MPLGTKPLNELARLATAVGVAFAGGLHSMARMAAAAKKTTSAKSNPRGNSIPLATEKDVRVRVFQGHSGNVWRVAMPEDGRFALTSSEDGTVRRWEWAVDGTEGEIVCKGESFYGLAVTEDGRRAAVVDYEGTIQLLDLATPIVRWRWKGHTGPGGLTFNT